MIYATQIENLTIVAAADSPAELEQFHTNVGIVIETRTLAGIWR